MIEFHLDGRSNIATYMQLVQQVKQALRLGMLEPGEQLPTVREVAESLAINPNTVLKAYRELELEGLVEAGRVWARWCGGRWPGRHWAARRRCAGSPSRGCAGTGWPGWTAKTWWHWWR